MSAAATRNLSGYVVRADGSIDYAAGDTNWYVYAAYDFFPERVFSMRMASKDAAEEAVTRMLARAEQGVRYWIGQAQGTPWHWNGR